MTRNSALASVLALLVVGLAIWWFFLRSEGKAPTPAQPVAEVSEPAQTSAPAPAAATAIVAQPATVSPTLAAAMAAAVDKEPWESERIRPFPRKKKRQWEVDLDGDGLKEKLSAVQTPSADAWAGGEGAGSPQAGLEVRHGAGNEIALKRKVPGYALGLFALPARVGGGRHVVFALEAAIDGPSELPGWLTIERDGKARLHAMKQVPLELLDLSGSGRDAVTTLSTELYMQFMAAGTMDVLGWHQGALASIMPFAAFEVCALEPGGDAPLLVVAVTRNKHAIHLLTYDGTEEKLVSAWHAKVSPPDDGEHYNVPRGFALACSYPQERPHRVQYKNRTFTLARSGDALVEGPKAKRPGQ